jgi:hypothetical protein
VGAFADSILVRLSTPDGLRDLVFAEGDPDRTRVRALFAEAYDLPFATVHDVVDVQVTGVECQRPVFPAVRRTGNWLQTIPAGSRTDFTVEGRGAEPRWIDVVAELAVTVVLAVDPGGLASLTFRDLGGFASLEEFRAKFGYFDLDAFMAEHGLTTVDDLREAFRYQIGEVRLKPIPPFDPDDPAHRRVFRFALAVLVREDVDLTGTLRDVRLLTAGEAGYPHQVDAAEARAAYAPLLVFPADTAGGGGPDQQRITDFFAGQRVLAVFEQP